MATIGSVSNPQHQLEVHGKAGRRIASLNFQPDFVWLKDASTTTHNGLFDSIRGPNIRLVTNQNTAEDTQPMCTSFNADGFTTGDHHNTSPNTHVGMCWKAGNESVVDGTGTINVTRSTNVDAGFSILSWTGTGVAGTLPHGLGKNAEFIYYKNRESTHAHYVWHKSLDSGKGIYFSYADGSSPETTNLITDNGDGNNLAVSTGAGGNQSGSEIICYAWTGIEGFSRFGSYIGNGNADGPFVWCGFKPAFIFLKKDASEGWVSVNNRRNEYNKVTGAVKSMQPNSTGAERSDLIDVDFVSNGFKFRGTDSAQNSDGGTYFFMAWAEMPFKYATGR